MRRFFSVLAGLVGLALAACDGRAPAAAAADGAGGTGGAGGAGRPRVVVLSPGLAVTLRDIGLGDLLVGRHGFDAWSDQSLPVCGDQSGIDYERLLGLRPPPTHIFVQWGERELPARLVELARRRGWEVRALNPLSIDQVRAAAVEMYETLTPADEREGQGEEGPEWLRAFDRSLRRREADLSRIGRVMLMEAAWPPGVLGPGSYHHDILVRIGGTPAVTEGTAYIVMDAEDVLALAPDAIVVLSPRPAGASSGEAGASRTGPVTAEEAAGLLGAVARLDIPAVRRGRVALIDDPECLLPATSLSRFADDLAGVLEGWAAEDEEGRGGSGSRSAPEGIERAP